MTLRILRSRIALAATCIALGACATAPRGPAAKIGTAGTNLATALSAQTSKIAKDVALDPAVDAFYRVYVPCKTQYAHTPTPATCTASLADAFEDPAAKYMREYAQILRLEAAAFKAQASAYTALKSESDFDASGAATEAIGGAAKAADTLAKAAVPAAALVPIAEIVKIAAGDVVSRRQTKRLMVANDRLDAIAQILLFVQQQQQANVLDAIRTIESNRTNTVKALIDEGVVSRGDMFAKLLKDTEITPTGDAAKKIDASPLLKDSVDSALKQLEGDRLQNRFQQSDTAIAALTALIDVHDQFRRTGRVETAPLESLTVQLASEPAVAAAPAATAAPAAPSAGKDKVN